MARASVALPPTPPNCATGFVGGARHAIGMLEILEGDEEIGAACDPNSRYRGGAPQQNIVLQFLHGANAAGVEATEGFCSVLTGWLSISTAGSAPDSDYLSQHVEQRARAEAARTDAAFERFMAKTEETR